MQTVTHIVSTSYHAGSPNDSWSKRLRRVVEDFVRDLSNEAISLHIASGENSTTANGFKVNASGTSITKYTMKKSTFESTVNSGVVDKVDDCLRQAVETPDRCGVPPWATVEMLLEVSKYMFTTRKTTPHKIESSTPFKVKVTIPMPDLSNITPQDLSRIMDQEMNIRNQISNLRRR